MMRGGVRIQGGGRIPGAGQMQEGGRAQEGYKAPVDGQKQADIRLSNDSKWMSVHILCDLCSILCADVP